MRGSFPGVVLCLLIMGVLAGCDKVEEIRESLRGQTPHEQYAASLRAAGLEDTELARQWLQASMAAFIQADSISLPFREARYLDPAQPAAISYRMALQRGQRLFVQVTAAPDDTSRLFVDLYRLPPDTTEQAEHVLSADSTYSLQYDVRSAATFLLRAQPELLRGGRYTVTIQTDASLRFPVAGVDSRAIRSFFGAPRDGGSREHHGVDIFAPRGTPAVAAADGIITRVREGGLGGKVVWLQDGYGQHLYYAHLDSQLVRPGMRVSVGDTVGLVGNTGNARTTPPHLHFGIYQRGPTDPFPFIHTPTEQPAEVRADTSQLGRWAQVVRANVSLQSAPDRRAEAVRTLEREAAVLMEGSNGSWHRVQLPDGTHGYLAEAQIQRISETYQVAGKPVRAAPSAEAIPIDTLGTAVAVTVLGRFDGYQLVETPAGRVGWVAAQP